MPRQRLRQINMSRGAIGEDGSVRLQSSDGETFEVSVRVARLSRTIDTMLRGQHFVTFISINTEPVINFYILSINCGLQTDLYSIWIARVTFYINFFADLGHEPDDLIPLPKVNARILKKVYAYLKLPHSWWSVLCYWLLQCLYCIAIITLCTLNMYDNVVTRCLSDGIRTGCLIVSPEPFCTWAC